MKFPDAGHAEIQPRVFVLYHTGILLQIPLLPQFLLWCLYPYMSFDNGDNREIFWRQKRQLSISPLRLSKLPVVSEGVKATSTSIRLGEGEILPVRDSQRKAGSATAAEAFEEKESYFTVLAVPKPAGAARLAPGQEKERGRAGGKFFAFLGLGRWN